MNAQINQPNIDALTAALYQLQAACDDRANKAPLSSQNYDALNRSGIRCFIQIKRIRMANLSWVVDEVIAAVTRDVVEATNGVNAIADDATCRRAFSALHIAQTAVEHLLVP